VAQIADTDTLVSNAIDTISATALTVGGTNATKVKLGSGGAPVSFAGNAQPDITDTEALGSLSKAWSDIFLWDGVDGRALSDASTGAPGAQLIGIKAGDFTTIAPGADNVYAALLATDTAVGAVTSNPSVVKIFDDFTGNLSEWSQFVTAGGSVKIGTSASAFGFPSAGVLGLSIDATALAQSLVFRPTLGLVLGPSSPIVLTARFFISNSGGAASDDQCSWLFGMADKNGNNQVAVGGNLTGGGGTRKYIMSTQIGAGAPSTETIPAFPVGNWYTVRLTVSETGTLVEASANDAPLSVVLSGANAPAHIVYLPEFAITKDTGTGNRNLVVDWLSITATRAAPDSGAVTGTEFITAPVYALQSSLSSARSWLKFSGTLTGLAVGTVNGYFTDSGSAAISAPNSYPMPGRVAKTLRVNVISNALTTATTIAIQKNGVNTGLTLNYAGAATGIQTVTTDVTFSSSDTMDLIATNTNGTVGLINLSATLELSAT